MKLHSLKDLAIVVDDMRDWAKPIVHAHGCFDLLHIGHIWHLKSAKAMGNTLIVTITADPFINKGPGRPVFNEDLRAEALCALECVDYVAINPAKNAAKAIAMLRPDFFCKGPECGELFKRKDLDTFNPNFYAEMVAIDKVGGGMYITGDPVFSSTEIMRKVMAM